MKFLLVSLIVLIPCFWQGHIQAGDLGSHMYNVWLAQLIQSGQVPGLYLEPIFTNVLFDLWAGWLTGLAGFLWGERLAVATVVLTMFWGSWMWIRSVTTREPWPVTPLLAIFVYGWVFQAGFLNFFWSLGFCFWALALAESGNKWAARFWWLLLIAAATAHMLPVAWAVALWLYGQGLRRISGRWQEWFLLAGLAVVAAAAIFVRKRFASEWLPDQVVAILGVDQVLLMLPQYLAIVIGLLAIWALGFLWALDAEPLAVLGRKPHIHFLVLTAFGVLMVPWAVQLPFFSSPLSFITQRMSLVMGVLLCALLVSGNRPRWVLGISIPIAISYHWLVYRDTLPLDHFEDALYQAVRTMPAGLRVVAPFERDSARAFGYGHIVDRACIGHCYSYANYEAATRQFRVRAKGPNPIVTHDNETSLALQAAKHVVGNSEAPIYYFKWLPEQQRFELRVLQGGDTF